ncbi:MAG: SLC13 family permease [Rhodanobacteraceae bacterium]|nr:SLC13 family permease [Pseudomonadota bacterium]
MTALTAAINRLKHDHLLQALLALALLLAVLDPRPAHQYLQWLDLRTLAGLTGLLILIQGMRESGYIQRWAIRLVTRLRGVRALAIVLVLLSAGLSAVLTNDVSLFLIVPLTLAIDRVARIPRQRLVIGEALAVNAGSTFSPIGNPQNLLLWQHSGVSFPAFVLAIAPAGAIMLSVLLIACAAMFPSTPLQLDERAVQNPATNAPLALGAAGLLIGMVAALQWGYAIPAAITVLIIGAAFFKRTLAGVDWMLLLTFAAMFVGLGHLAVLPIMHAHVGAFDWRDPRVTYLGGIALSQVTSNVPAAVLLQHYTPDLLLLAIAVNVGGSGIAIGSLANLIALRLDGSPRIGWRFHLYSIPYLLISGILVGVWLLFLR